MTWFADEERVRGQGPWALTAREREILEAYILDGTYKVVAHRLGISEQTVKNHVSRIFMKLDVGSITQACVMYALYHPTCKCECGCKSHINTTLCGFCEIGEHE